MTMIECPECSQKLSKSAATCTSCGHKMYGWNWISRSVLAALVLGIMLLKYYGAF